MTRHAILSLLVILAVAGVASAQVSPAHDLSWHVVAAGGAGMASGGHRVNGTLGQLAIGPAQGAEHGLCAGYWCGVRREVGYSIYLPLLTRGWGGP
jgi:hypothetical protein